MQNDDVENINTLDGQWYRELISIQSPLLLSTLALPESDETLLQNFLTHQKPPRLDKSKLPIAEIEKAIKQCKALLAKIIHNEGQKAIRLLYVDKINETIKTQELLRSVYYDDRDIFLNAQADLFGKFDSKSAKAAFQELTQPTGISEELMKRAVSTFPTMALPIVNGGIYTASNVADIWNETLMQSAETREWRAITSAAHFRVTVAARPKLIHIPINAKMSASGVKRLFAHEVYAHIARRTAGRKSHLKLLRVGTAHALRAEEGLALMAEQIALDSNSYRGRDKFFALTVALGLRDGKAKNFFETFDALYIYFKERFDNSKASRDSERLATRHAWTHSRSIFRCSDPDDRQSHFIRGKVYLEGNMEMWHFLERANEKQFLRLFTGRIKPDDYPLLDELENDN